MSRTRLPLALLTALGVAGCGGGGDGRPAPADRDDAPGPRAVAVGTAFAQPDERTATGTRLSRDGILGIGEPLPARTGSPVQITSVRPLTSPGLELEPIRRRDSARESVVFTTQRWPDPRYDDGPLTGAPLPGKVSSVLGVSARRDGVYLIEGLDLRYTQDGREFAQTVPASYCFVVGAGPRGCTLGSEFPAQPAVASLGGPITEGTRLRAAGSDATTGVEAVVPATPGTHTLVVPLTNRGTEPVRVSDLQMPDTASDDFRLRPVGKPSPPLTLDPRTSGKVRLRYATDGCQSSRAELGIDTLAARLDGAEVQIPLAVPIAFAGCT